VAYLHDFSEFHVYVKDVTARKLAEQKLAYQAFFDPASGLPNQYRLRDELSAALAQQSYNAPIFGLMASEGRRRTAATGLVSICRYA